MDSGIYAKTSGKRTGDYDVYKTTVTRRPKGKVIAVNMDNGMRFDGVEQERLLRIAEGLE